MRYSGNDWQGEATNLIKVAAKKAPLKDKVDEVKVFVAGTEAQKQISQIQQMIAQRFDIILIYPISTTALNGVIKQGCDAGITMMTYDSQVTEPCAHNVTFDQADAGKTTAEALADLMGDKGNIVMITGVAGTYADEQRTKAAEAVFKERGIKVLGKCAGDWAQGPSGQCMSQFLASFDNIEGVWAQAGGPAILEALDAKGKDYMPIVGESENQWRLDLINPKYVAKGLKGVSYGSPPYQGAAALHLAVDSLANGTKLESTIDIGYDYFTQDEIKPRRRHGRRARCRLQRLHERQGLGRLLRRLVQREVDHGHHAGRGHLRQDCLLTTSCPTVRCAPWDTAGVRPGARRPHEHGSSSMNIDILLDVKPLLGEGPLWDVEQQRLYFIDSLGMRIFRCTAQGTELRSWTVPAPIGSMALTSDGEGAVIVLSTGIHTIDFRTGDIVPVMDPEPGLDENRLNDGKVDRRGRFVFGSMNTAETDATGRLYSLSPDWQLSVLDQGIICSNGPCWSPDDQTFYFCDSWSGEIWAYDYDIETGGVANRRRFAAVEAEGLGAHDGSTVDAEGFVWNAFVYEGKLARFAPDGTLDRVIDMPVKKVTSVMFGGPDLDVLYVTSMAEPPLPAVSG
ncbi:SMP-30/gluconolactonase/LRE family protein [Aeromicrobium sp. UC242_57]|uniref:SMP-30/gluconolactonase/LRE family protein n=1 Tax=Aeromicrobium sp. UC242_57 TaxID=3374624 RepID=UPI0037B305E4